MNIFYIDNLSIQSTTKKFFFLQTLLEWSSETNQIIPLQKFQLVDSCDSKLKNKPSKRNEFHKLQTIRFHIWNWFFHVWKDRTDRWKESDFNSSFILWKTQYAKLNVISSEKKEIKLLSFVEKMTDFRRRHDVNL